MGLFKFLLGQPSREYSDNVKGKWAEDAWSDIDHRKITDKYYPQMEKIEEQWSIMYNLKNYTGKRAEKFEQLCKDNRINCMKKPFRYVLMLYYTVLMPKT